MVTNIQGLPRELLSIIVSGLRGLDLKQARLTCRLWGTLGVRWMFQLVYFAPREISMQTFTHIAGQPHLSMHVRELAYDGRQFLNMLTDSQNYTEMFNSRRLSQAYVNRAVMLPSEINTNVEESASNEYREYVESSCRDYTRLHLQQFNILEEASDLEYLCVGLQNFPRLSRISVLQGFKGVHDCYDESSAQEFGIAVEPSSGVQNEEVGNVFQCYDFRGIRSLFQAIDVCRSPIRELRIDSQMLYIFLLLLDCSTMDAIITRTLARNLIALELGCPTMYQSAIGLRLREPLNEIMSKVLSVAMDLRHFSYFGLHGQRVLANQHWPRLPELILGYRGFPSDCLIKVIHAHKDTLRKLALRTLYFYQGWTWENVGKQAGTFLTLHCVHLVELGDEIAIARSLHKCLDYKRLQNLAFDLMQWKDPDKLHLEEGTDSITARLKAIREHDT